VDRYARRPLLKLLEAWALDVVGELTPAARGALVRMEPQLRATFHAEGGWREIIARTLALGPEHEAEVRAQWERWRATHPRGDALRFAQELADALLAD
jgi:hypothetical protein